MKPRQLQAKGGQKYPIRLDKQTATLMNRLSEEIGVSFGFSPSQAVLIRRAIDQYGAFILEDLLESGVLERLQREKDGLLAVARRR